MPERSQELAEIGQHPGLCASCSHLRLMRSSRSVFVRCGKAEEDRDFVKYPAIPVMFCPGHQKSPSPSR